MVKKQIGILATAAAFVAGTALVHATLVLEYDANQNVSDTGGLVDTWDDTVGARQAAPDGGNAARRPTLVSSVFESGQPGIRFDAEFGPNLGERDVLTFNDNGLITGDYSIVTAFKLTALEHDGNFRPTWFAIGDQFGGPFHTAAVGVNRPVGCAGLLLRMNGTDVNSALTLSTDVNYVSLITRSGDNYTFDLLSMSGTASATGVNSSSALVFGADLGRIGNLVTSAHADFAEAGLEGYVGLIQLYDTALTAGERTTLLGQLNSYVLIPEPSILGMLGLGMLLLMRRRFFRA